MKTLIQHSMAVLMDEARTVLSDAYVSIDGSEIVSVGTERPKDTFGQVIDAKGKVLMPGFVNAHTHVPMTLMRGYGGGHPLQEWLNDYIFPAEAKWDSRAMRAAAQLGLAEMIASGVTCIADMYMDTETIAQAVLDAGLSANLCCGGVLFAPEFDPETYSECRIQRELYHRWYGAGDGRILIDASIHAEYTSRPELWEWTADFAKTHGLGMHMHMSETRKEHEECVQKYNLTPAGVFAKYGVFDVRAIAAHCVWTTPEDWEIMASHGVSAIHNPVSNLKLGSGIAPVPAMSKAGINVGLGTDGVSSNNATDLFGEMKLAAILHNGVSCDPLAVDPYEALKMATVNGAKALGRKTGQIAPGYAADLILVDFSRPNNYPCHDVIENLVYASHSADVVMNMCRGEVIYQEGNYFTLNLAEIKSEIESYAIPKMFC